MHLKSFICMCMYAGMYTIIIGHRTNTTTSRHHIRVGATINDKRLEIESLFFSKEIFEFSIVFKGKFHRENRAKADVSIATSVLRK